MRKDKFRILVLTLVVCMCAISVSAQEIESAKSSNQFSIKKTAYRQSANQLSQPTCTKNGFSAQFAFADTSAEPVFLTEIPNGSESQSFPGPISWACVYACSRLLPIHVCVSLCVMN